MRAFSYKKLFVKLIDLAMTNNELMEKVNISKSTFYKTKKWTKCCQRYFALDLQYFGL